MSIRSSLWTCWYLILSQTDNSDTEHHGVLIVCKLIKPSKIIKSRRFNKLKELRVFVRLDIDTLCDSVNWFLFHKIVMNIFRCRISLEIRYISTKTRATSGISIKKTRTEIFCKMRNLQVIYIYEGWLAAWYIKGKLFATQALSQTQKNVSEPQTGIEPATFWSPVRRSNHWATRTQMAERRPRY